MKPTVEIRYEPSRGDHLSTYTSIYWRGSEIDVVVFQASCPSEAQEMHEEFDESGSHQQLLQEGDCSYEFRGSEDENGDDDEVPVVEDEDPEGDLSVWR